VVVLLSLAAAMCFAAASVLQQQAAASAPPERSMRLRLLVTLVQRPRWVAGIAADVSGFALQVAALDHGPLAVVQPLLATGLLFALVFNASPRSSGLRAVDWWAALAVAAGLTVFVVAGHPSAPKGYDADAGSWVALIATAVALMGGSVAMAARRSPASRALFLSMAAGVSFGLTAVLTKQSVTELNRGWVHLLSTGYPYGLAVLSVVATVLSQSAFQAGTLAASLPTLTLVEPLFAASTGIWLFGEHLAHGGAQDGLAGLAALAACVGVVALARSPSAQPTLSRAAA